MDMNELQRLYDEAGRLPEMLPLDYRAFEQALMANSVEPINYTSDLNIEGEKDNVV